MLDEPAEPRPARGAALGQLAAEDLSAYPASDLEDRIAQLQGEIERTRGALAAKREGRSAADALFSFG
jgi:uncharacterized small protein (DUF1192 family)